MSVSDDVRVVWCNMVGATVQLVYITPCTKTFRKEKFTHYGSANRQSFQLYSSENNQEHFFTIFLNLKIYYFR